MAEIASSNIAAEKDECLKASFSAEPGRSPTLISSPDESTALEKLKVAPPKGSSSYGAISLVSDADIAETGNKGKT
ncbi:hypothetical protein U1Q18_047567 [Sarracenia purpurea var. burkii]